MKADTTTSLTGAGAPGPASRLPERPVFVADHGRRHALIRAMIFLGAALIAAWLIALVAGALGWGNLPGVPFSEGSDHGKPATSASQAKSAREQAAAQRQGTSSPANKVMIPSTAGGRASSGSSLLAPHRSQSAIGASSTPAGSGASAGTGSQQSPGLTGPSNPGTTTPSNGAGRGPGKGGSTLPHESGQPDQTPNGNVPAQNANGGNPNAPAYGKGGNPGH